MKPERPLSDMTRASGEHKERTWNFATLNDLHVHANGILRQAMLNERYKRWRKVIELYKELLWVISLENLPDDYEPPSSYSMLLYELHFHLGVAYQHLNNHRKAVKEFTRTIYVVSIAKNGCLAGCLTNSCLMTPIYTRRAYAQAKLGSYKLALKDAEQAVVLDSQSPDVYCIRALVRSTFDDELLGLKDLETALKLDPKHVCGVMLKASFTKPLVTDDNEQYGCFGKFSGTPKAAIYERLKAKAVKLCQEVETYLTCNSFVHPCIQEFYDKFLFSLSIPHTITRINLTPEKPSKKQLDSRHSNAKQEKEQGQTSGTTAQTEVFRCGTITGTVNNRMALKRRTDYGKAIRKYMGRPKSAPEFFAQLEKQRRLDTQQKRSQSALVRPGERFARPFKSATTEEPAQPQTRLFHSANPAQVKDYHMMQSTPSMERRPYTAPVGARINTMSPIRSVSPEKHPPTPVMASHEPPRGRDQTDGHQKVHTKKTIHIETPVDYTMPVFQAVNIKSTPRMYYRPWGGDKLPVSEKAVFQYSPAFY